MPSYIVRLVDSISQLFITAGWVYAVDVNNVSIEVTTNTGGSEIGRADFSLPDTLKRWSAGKRVNGIEQYQIREGTTLSISPVANQVWLIPVGQPQSPYVCPECQQSFETQEELTAHHAAVHEEPTDSRCYIVTYVRPEDAVLWHYRQFRDRCLPKNVIKFYYWFSPNMVKTFRGHETLRKLIKHYLTKLSGKNL